MKWCVCVTVLGEKTTSKQIIFLESLLVEMVSSHFITKYETLFQFCFIHVPKKKLFNVEDADVSVLCGSASPNPVRCPKF